MPYRTRHANFSTHEHWNPRELPFHTSAVPRLPWFKIDDGFWSHPKTLQLSDGAQALWMRAGSWSMHHLTDGFIPDYALPILSAKPRYVNELRMVSLWFSVEDGNQFHDWKKYQPTREQVESDRHAAAERKRLSRERSQRDGGRDSPRSSGDAAPTPTRPDPTRPKEEAKASSRRRPETPFPDDWKPTEAHIQYARDNRLDLGRQVEAFKGHAETHDRRARNWDAAFRTWLGKATPGPARTVTPDNEWMFNR